MGLFLGMLLLMHHWGFERAPDVRAYMLLVGHCAIQIMGSR